MKHRTEPDGIEAVLLAGPTASGKSALALALAERFSGSIVNTDSMQVYQDLSVITARPGKADLERAPHRLYGHVDGAVNHSAGLWRDEAAALLSQERLRLPIFTGGTGLYFRALEQGLAAMPQVPQAVREGVRGKAEGVPTPALHARLAASDPAMALRLRPSDRQRILRALEVMAATGRSLADWQDAPHTQPLVSQRQALRVFLAPDREALKHRIDARFEAMVLDGALDEVERLAGRGLDPALPVMRAHGVPWLIRHLRAEIGLGEAIERAKADTRRYARRQFTWFRHQMPGWLFVPPDEASERLRVALDAGAAPRPAVVSD